MTEKMGALHMYSIYQYFGYDMPLEERFALIKAAGFDAVGLWRDDWFGWSGHRRYADAARAAGLRIMDGHAPFVRDNDFVNAIWLDNLDGKTTCEIYKRTVIEAAEDGVKNLIMHIDDRDAPPPNELGVRRLRQLVDLAEESNVTLALENIFDNRYLRYVFDRIVSPNLGFCYDAGHRNCNEPSADLLALFGDKLVALHLHDNDGSGDQHLIPFEGKIDWMEQMAKIAATGYAGATTLECTAGGPGSTTPNNPRSAEEWLRDAFAAAEKLNALRQ
jgi:sugar phosphate isomerase/epimerase